MVIGDILAIERDDSGINVDDLDPREDYPKPELVKWTEGIEINGKGRTTQIETLLDPTRREK